MMGGATLLARYMCIGMLLVVMGGATLLARYMCIGMLLVMIRVSFQSVEWFFPS